MLANLTHLLLAACTWPLRVSLDLLRRLRVGRGAVLELHLGGDRSTGANLGDTLAVLDALRTARGDPRVRAVLLNVRPVPGGWASTGELRGALAELKAAGKQVLVHLDVAGLRELYLVSIADRVWLTPSSQLLVGGLSAQITFYGDLLDRLGVQVDLEAAGAFKSFGEPFTRSWASQPNREQLQELLGDLQEQILAAVCTARGIERPALDEALGSSPLPAERALELGLVDQLAYLDEVQAHLESLYGEEVRRVDFGAWARLLRWRDWLARLGRPDPRLVVLHLEGPVVHGAEGMGGTGLRIDADRVLPVLDQLRDEERVPGVVLYVNSPGGSALASDVIARAVGRLAEQKPVVALFGDVSASGGYYLSAPAHEVIARPGTITGSIGVVGGKLVVGEGLGRAGVHHEAVPVGPDAGMFLPFAPFTEDQRRRFRASLERTYARFLEVVAAGRGMSTEEVEPHAQGRVWTGQQAAERALVDSLGGLDHALDRLRARAKLGVGEGLVVHLRFPPPRLKVLSSLLGRGEGRLASVLQLLGREAALPPLVALLRASPGRPLALLPWRLP